MRRLTMIVAIIVVAVIIGIGVAVSTRKTAYSPGTSAATDSTPSDTATNTHDTVTIKNMMFTPSQVTTSVGSTVIWTNDDTVAHTVTIDQGEGPSSGSIAPGSTYSFTFTKAGSYQYHCSIHPSMRGTIVVR